MYFYSGQPMQFLSGVDIRGSDLKNSSFIYVDFRGAVFDKDSELTGADLRGAKLQWTTGLDTVPDWQNAIGDSNTTLPAGFQRPSHWK
jgi:uncharacterized protein YjbI with pentapeptide repeats